jgi:hypothetical protein
VPLPDPPPEDRRETIRDLLGILRAMYVKAAVRLSELDTVLATEPQGSPAYVRAMRAAAHALNRALDELHFNAGLAPVLGARGGARKPRRGS